MWAIPVICFLSSCGLFLSYPKDIRSETIIIKTLDTDYTVPTKYKLNILAKAKKKKVYPRNGRLEVEYRFSYPDESIFYFSNDVRNGSPLNYNNLFDIGIKAYNKRDQDTLSNEGIQNDGKYWKEQMLGKVVVGYVNVKKENKLIFDALINSIEELE